MHTTSYWLTLPEALMEQLPYRPAIRLSGVRGLAHAMRQIAVLFLMCDLRDIQVAVEDNLGRDSVPPTNRIPSRSGQSEIIYEPNIFIYDNYPSGIGLSQLFYDMHDQVLGEIAWLIRS